MPNIADIRKAYEQKTLLENDIAADPFKQFDRWWDDAIKSGLDEVNAMTLATIGLDGNPTARIVLLKGYDEKGFIFFTNYNSNKGKELEANGSAALLFFWAALERQVRINGLVAKISEEESDAYFRSRPVDSKIGAWASPQSSPVKSREIIEENEKKYTGQFKNMTDIPRPPHWGGYIVKPNAFEFWQGRPSRLHDRIVYKSEPGNSWKAERLAP